MSSIYQWYYHTRTQLRMHNKPTSKYTFLVCDEDLYLYKTIKPYNEGYIKKVGPTNIIIPMKNPKTKDLQIQNLPMEIIIEILFQVSLYKFRCREFKQTYKILLLHPQLFTRFYQYFFPKESNEVYSIYFKDGYQEIYQDRISRTLYLCTKLHQQITKPSYEFPSYFVIEIFLNDANIFYPILPWTIIEGKKPMDYNIEMNICTNEYPNENENHFAFITGPAVGDIAWVRGTFYNDNILLASTFQRPVLPILFTGRLTGLYKGEDILKMEKAWIYLTKMLQYTYGEDMRLYIGNQNRPFDYTFHDSLDPRFLQ